MNNLKIEMIGSAIVDAQQEATGREPNLLDYIQAPPEAESMRYVKGIIGLVMEGVIPGIEVPQKLSDLRDTVVAFSGDPEDTDLLRIALLDLLEADILRISTERGFHYLPPSSPAYHQALLIND
jgi:hypothetical protein